MFCRCARMLVLGLWLCALASPASAQSIAREWNEALLGAIRADLARPPVHARNLWHVSIAMWDAWAAYDPDAAQFLHEEKLSAVDIAAARAETLSFAVYRILEERFLFSPGEAESMAAFEAIMLAHGYDINNFEFFDNTPAALGNRIADTVLNFGYDDNSNEFDDYANIFYTPVNPALVPSLPGNPSIVDPNRWQPLSLDFFIDQGGNVIPGGSPAFQSAEWGQVSAFALSPADLTINQRGGFGYWVYHDPGPAPQLGGTGDADYKWGFEMVSAWSSHLDPSDGVTVDISPGAIGNAALPPINDFRAFYDFENGGDWGPGHSVNPSTGLPYAAQVVPRGDYARVLAEFWADGPDSETPPGHWFVIGNYVSDQPETVKKIQGQGSVLDDLEWDVKLYFALGGAMHDSAVAAWGIKGWYDYVRPVSALRHMADNGQSSDALQPSFDPSGISLRPGLIELVSAATTAPGERHQHLVGSEGKIALYAWRGPDSIADPLVDEAGVGWILAENWWPYQRPSFVTPPFAGYVSGHSTYSRAGAVILANFTGSDFFPGGLGEFQCLANEFLVFEDGPSVDITLQWATYYDASDQTSLSRIWGGIHPAADDIPGRYIGQQVGEDAFAKALTYFGSTSPPISVPIMPAFGSAWLVASLLGTGVWARRRMQR